MAIDVQKLKQAAQSFDHGIDMPAELAPAFAQWLHHGFGIEEVTSDVPTEDAMKRLPPAIPKLMGESDGEIFPPDERIARRHHLEEVKIPAGGLDKNRLFDLLTDQLGGELQVRIYGYESSSGKTASEKRMAGIRREIEKEYGCENPGEPMEKLRGYIDLLKEGKSIERQMDAFKEALKLSHRAIRIKYEFEKELLNLGRSDEGGDLSDTHEHARDQNTMQHLVAVKALGQLLGCTAALGEAVGLPLPAPQLGGRRHG